MNCANHPDVTAVAFCRSCGKALCAACRRPALNTIFCAEHVPLEAASLPPTPPGPNPYATPSGPAPALAFLLGMIPGVGAIYNGQYAKGLIHAVIFGLLITAINSHSTHGLEPLLGILLAAWFFYMAIEAYHTASKRRNGEPVDEFSSLIRPGSAGGFPVGAVVLIGLGVLLLLDTTGLLDLDRLSQYWPVLLILLGVYMLYVRLGRGAAGEAADERR